MLRMRHLTRRRFMRSSGLVAIGVAAGCGSEPSDPATDAGADGSPVRPDGARLDAAPADAAPPDADRPAVDVPAWVPLPGEVAVLTQSNGGLTNRFVDQAAPYFSPFYYVNTVNDYSGAFKNPHWGLYGATVFWGGGHAGTNDNSVTVAEYAADAITFKRVSDPTPWAGEGTDEATRYSNSRDDHNARLDLAYMESTIDGQPGAPHSYCSGDVLGPADGGAVHGTLLQVAAAAVNVRNDAGALAAHHIRFDTTTLATASGVNRKWTRLTDATGDRVWPPTAAPFYTAFVAAQRRVYFLSQGGGLPGLVRWFDLATNTYVRGAGTGFELDGGDGYDSGIVFSVPSRDLVVCMYPAGGELVVQWMDVSADEPTLGGTATLSEAIRLALPWSAGCWCPHSERIVLIGAEGDDAAAYEIEIPRKPSSAWPVTRAPFGAGQLLVPKDPEVGIGLTYKKFHYDERVRAIVYMPLAAREGDDTVYVYRPRGT